VLLFTWPYNFDVSSRKPKSIKELPGLSPGALCRLQIDLTRNWSFFWRNQKFYVADGTVCTKPLRMCSFHQQRWFDSMNF